MQDKLKTLKKKKDFDRIFQKGLIYKGRFLLLRVLRNNLSCSRYAIVLGLKVDKKAVVRNKVKRRIRESVFSLREKLKPGFDFVITVTPQIKQKKFQEIQKDLQKTSQKAKII